MGNSNNNNNNNNNKSWCFRIYEGKDLAFDYRSRNVCQQTDMRPFF